jgi:membrane dipeptidase
MDRRQFLVGGAGSLAAPTLFVTHASARTRTFIADMHFHLLFFGPSPATSRSLAREMAAGNVTLGAWSLVGDIPWLGRSRRGFVQKGTPSSSAAVAWFQAELARIRGYLAGQNLKIVREPADVDRALAGDPHVVLSVEGATFADNDLGQLRTAYDAGIRHIQLVHYVRNTIGDFQTERPEHGGLTEFGRSVVRECNRLGILVDLAHCTDVAVTAALAVSKVPMVWSHSSVTRGRTPHWSMPAWQARQLTVGTARAIARQGGVVGLWAVRTDVGQSVAAYADRLAEMADLIGEDNAAFGTDMNGLINPVISSFADLQRVVDHWDSRNIGERRIRKLAIENYARVLKQAFAARQA